MPGMAASFRLSDEFWSVAKPLIPKPTRRHPLGGGRPRVADRRVLEAILFVLRTGCQWKALDATGLGSGSTAHRRFQEWVSAGFFGILWRVAAQRYDELEGIDWRWLAADGCITKAPLSRSEAVGRNPTDRGKQGVKRSLLVDSHGIPLALAVGPANQNDHLLLGQTLDALVIDRPDPAVTVQNLCLDDAGQFHAGFGIIVPVDEETVEFCVQASVRGERTPFRYPLASTLYGDSIRAAAPIGPGDEELLSALLKILPTDFALPAGDRKPLKAKPKSPRKR